MSRSNPTGGPREVVQAHLSRLQACLRAVSSPEIAAVAERLLRVAQAGGLVLVAGNGGSAATASHMALDLGKSTLGRPPRTGRARVRTFCLSDPSPVLTAWANDESYTRIFAEQIITLAHPGDAVVLLSVSGDSPNIVEAARAAREAGATVIALLGGRGGAVRALADLAVVVPSEDYGVVEDVHLAINHIVTRYLREALETEALEADRSRRGGGLRGGTRQTPRRRGARG